MPGRSADSNLAAWREDAQRFASAFGPPLNARRDDVGLPPIDPPGAEFPPAPAPVPGPVVPDAVEPLPEPVDSTPPPAPEMPRGEGPYRVHLAGVGGMGIGVAGRILIEAAAGEWP